MFDPEKVGGAIAPTLGDVFPVRDFQDYPPWRELVVASLASLHRFAERTIIAPQTVVVERYWDEISAGLDAAGISVHAFTLDCTPEEHERRIVTDAKMPNSLWRRERAAEFRRAHAWLSRRTEVIDTTVLTPAEVANSIATTLAESGTAAPPCSSAGF
ncbi:ATP-binding protein [Myceligenerans sp. I2]|uniref:ATP-binding protein n=1 Tax=Myceligenerans indicum TaxID=2593663 RepID=A0ABS1LRW4_9MICO|nr:ATP-binding protein [Myceligenerans indicum]